LPDEEAAVKRRGVHTLNLPGAFYLTKGNDNPFTAGWTVVTFSDGRFGVAFSVGRRTPLEGDFPPPPSGKKRPVNSTADAASSVREGFCRMKRQL
jgi:hypothetical protein